jgi:hypothetical protein
LRDRGREAASGGDGQSVVAIGEGGVGEGVEAEVDLVGDGLEGDDQAGGVDRLVGGQVLELAVLGA